MNELICINCNSKNVLVSRNMTSERKCLDCGQVWLPSPTQDLKFKKQIKERDELIRDAIAIISFLNPFKAGKSGQWIEKAKKIVGEK